MVKNMYHYVFAFLIALLVCEEQIIVGKADRTECGDDYKLFQESCYWLNSTEATRPDAVAACTPGHLVDITSEEEQDFIAGILTENRIRSAWFGLLKGLFWSDGSSLVQESWQNIRGSDGCFRLDNSDNNLWNDNDCNSRYKSVCEHEISDSEECRQGFDKFQLSCYQINDDTLMRKDAATECGKSQSHLVDITSIEEQEFVVGLLQSSDIGDAWFGLTLSDPPSWSDGSLLSSASWYDIKTGSSSVCFRLTDAGSAVYSWNDANSCQDTYRFVCEYEAVTTTVATTTAAVMSTVATTTATSNMAHTGVIFGISLGIVVLVILCVSSIAIAIIYYRRNSTDLKTPTTQPSHQDPNQVPDYQNVSNPKTFKSTDDNLGLDVNSLSKNDAGYQNANDNAMIGYKKKDQDVIYHDISENKSVKYDNAYARATEAATPGTAASYDYAYASPTEASIPAVNPNMDINPNKNAKNNNVNSCVRVQKS